MQITEEKYVLIKKDIPIISNNIVQHDPGVGGIKLVYEKYYVTYETFKFLGKTRKIQISKTRSGIAVFLQPFKKYWDHHTNRVKPNFWGKRSPLTKIWCKTTGDYTSLQGDYISKNIKRGPIYENQRIINILKEHPKSFTIEVGVL